MVQLTDYHAKYFAHELTKRCASDSIEKLAGALVDAQVDLNPHQVEAALFAFKSPLSKGAILADEVGLGKTIEAGLVLSQRWAKRKRRLLVITPANLRKQWYQELQEKFFLPCCILEAKSWRTAPTRTVLCCSMARTTTQNPGSSMPSGWTATLVLTSSLVPAVQICGLHWLTTSTSKAKS